MNRIVPLLKLAVGRSGDKGSSSNIGIIARHPDLYPFLRDHLTAERVKVFMTPLCRGEVVRYELPNLHAFNFILYDSLDGGGTVSLKLDAQGKTHAATLLTMEMEVPHHLLALVTEE